ncbi:Protein kinase-like domain [Lasallia pustulata]|uniref:Protein kinase-like domain n=1 Tax=Lasallia pustulata TaxID=136370 RepID=A0A1W5CSR8_9LECA|nr:Protein kinase-like domain [Lasallia pustulata]
MTSIPRDPVRLSVSILPSDERKIFQDSSFFTRGGGPHTLPSPAQVRAAADVQENKKVPFRQSIAVRFPSLNLIVKYGNMITNAEGQCLWAIRHLLHNAVPVPEVYGWCRDGNDVFIYMEMIHGDTLEQRWDGLTAEEKLEVCQQLHGIMENLRRLEQDSGAKFIGNINRKPLLDILFAGARHTPGPFPSISSFHDYFHTGGKGSSPSSSPDPYRVSLPDNVPITFTHSDLHRSNIIVTPAGMHPVRVLALIDWHQSGWLPAYWEYCKASFSSPHEDKWVTECVPKFLEKWDCYEAWSYFQMAYWI